MARLLRKRPPEAKKKKKKNAAEGVDAGVTDVAVVKKPAQAVTPVAEIPKKPVLAPKKALVKTRKEPGKLKGYLDQSIQFLREVKVELKKVTWPTRKQTMGSTVVVIILVIIISLFLGVVDMGLSSLLRVVLQ